MPVDVIEQVRRLVECFDELVDDVSTDEVLQRVGGVADVGEPADPAPPPSHVADRAGWRRFGLVAAAVVLVAGLVGALVWVSADRSPPSSDAPPETGATVPTVSLGEFVWPAPPRGYATLDDLVTAFTTEVLAWDLSDTDRVGEFNDRAQPQALTLVNERLGGDVAVIAIPSRQGWGFIQVGNGGLSASVDDDQTVALRYAPSARSASSTVEARLTDGTTVTLTASTGRLELPESVRVGDLVSALVVEFDEQGNVIAAIGGTYSASAPQTPPTLAVQATVPNSFDTVDVVGTWIVTRHERSVDDTGAKAFVPLPSPLPTYRFDDDGTLSGFDSCNSMVASWSFTDGRFTTPAVTNATAAATTIRCEDSTGIPLPTVGPSPQRLERIDGTITMVFTDQDGTNAHAQRLSDLPTPQQLAGSSWILAVEGLDVTVQFRRDGTAEFREDTTSCAAGPYTYDAGILVLDLEPAIDQCPDARLHELTANRLNAAVFSDHYMADTILLVPGDGGAVRLFPADGNSSDTATASTIETVDGS